MTLPSFNHKKSSRRNLPLVLPPTIPVYPLFSNSNQATSPSDTPRFNGPVPILKPASKHHGSRPKLGKLNINQETGDLPLFQHVAGPPRIDDVVDGSSTLSPEERTIRPQEDDPTSGQIIGRRSGSPSNTERSTNGDHGYVIRNENLATQPLDGLRESIGKFSIDSMPSSSAQGYISCPDPLSNRDSAPQGEFSDHLLEVLARLGEGAGGAVHKVRDLRNGEIYARKTITTREVAMKQVVREINIVSNTRHINIVPCFGAYVSPSSSEVKIVMEFCDGGSLEAVGKKIKEIGAVVGEKITGRLAEGILQGLSYLHSRKTIHRDIKPSNILLSRDGIVKLCDFGVSGELVESSVDTFTGTLIYMAPERISGGKYTIRSDVWSMGISLLELVKNRFPFSFPADAPTFEVVLTISKGQPPRLEDEPEAGITWSVEMKDFISQALTVDPSFRPRPTVMLEHPWIINMLKQEVDMARWISQVWGWPKSRSR